MNAELRRNLWLQMTGGRIAVGASLVLVLLVAALVVDVRIRNESFGVTRWVSLVTYLFVVLLWGGRQAAAAVVTEVREKTWDWQRLSAIGAWSMTIGKLAGAASLSWSLGLLCLVVFAVTKSLTTDAHEVPADVAFLLGLGVFIQAFGLMLSLMRVTRVPGYQPANVTLVQLMALVAAGLLGALLYAISYAGGTWYGIVSERVLFAALTYWFFGLWCVVGVYRRMKRELQFSVKPWLWLLFLVSLAAYAFGLEAPAVGGWTMPYLALYSAIALVFYVVLLFEPKSRGAVVRLFKNRSAADQGVGGVHKALAATPLWLLTFGFLILTVAFIAVVAPGRPLGFGGVNGLSGLVVALLLFALRDLMILLALVNRKDPLEPELMAFIIWFVLHGPLPAILMVGKLDAAIFLFWPDISAPLALMLLGPLAGAMIAGGIAWLIWWKNRATSDTSS